MSKVTKTLKRVLRGGSDANISFSDLRALLLQLGFVERICGSHHVFTRTEVAEILNLQAKGAKAKPYQVKQVRGVIVSYKLASQLEQASPTEDLSQGNTGEAPTEEGNGGQSAL